MEPIRHRAQCFRPERDGSYRGHRMPRIAAAVHRRGATVAELVVALALSALLAALGGAALVAIERYVRSTNASDTDQRVLREAAAVLEGELRAAMPDSIVVRGDTAADLLAGVGVSVLCVGAPGVWVLPTDDPSATTPLTVLRSTPSAGDVAAIFDRAAGWHTTLVDSTQWRTDGAGCSTSGGFRSLADSLARRRVLVLRLRDTLSARTGAPIRLFRRGRYALTRSTDGSWGLSWRACSALVVCGSAQPVAGPLASPGERGLVFTIDAAKRTVRAWIATPRRDGAGASREAVVALRTGDRAP